MNEENLMIYRKIVKDVKYTGPLEENNIKIIEALFKEFKALHPELYAFYDKNIIQGNTQKQIASELGISTSTVSSRIGKARTYLSHLFTKYRVDLGLHDDMLYNERAKELLEKNYKQDLESLYSMGLKESTIKDFHNRGVVSKQDLKQFILDLGPSWNYYVIVSQARANNVESELDIKWDNYYGSLEEYYDEILDMIEYKSSRKERNYNILHILLNYYKSKHLYNYDLFYKLLTNFDCSDIIDKYGPPTYNMFVGNRAFLKYIKRPEYLLLIFRGVEIGEEVKNYKLIHMANTTGFNVVPRKPYIANEDYILNFPISTRSKHILMQLGCNTYSDCVYVINKLGPAWYKHISRTNKFNIDEIEFILEMDS